MNEAEISMKSYMPNNLVSMVASRIDIREEPFWKNMLHHTIYLESKAIREKANIPVAKGCKLMGIPDPKNILKDNEVLPTRAMKSH